MFPIMDARGKVIGFGGRVMGEGEPKYLNSPETMIFDKSRSLYGLHLARTTKMRQILLCEGYMDVIALHQAGFDNAVAALGTAFTPGHANLLKRYTKEVYLTFDSDGAGVRAAKRAIPILKEAGIAAKVVNMSPYKDPDEFIKALGAKAYEERIQQAENSFLFEIRLLSEEYDLKDPAGKTAFGNEVAKKILQFDGELERDNYIEAIAEKYHMGFENLRKLVLYFGTQAGLVARDELKRIPKREKTKKEDGMRQSQKLLLTWLIEKIELFAQIDGLIGPEDFTEDLYRKVAKILFEQYRQDGSVNPAKIVNFFEEEEQKEIAALFNAKIEDVETEFDRQKAIKETILRIKQNSIAHRTKTVEPTDMAGLQKIIEDKKRLESLKTVHISIDKEQNKDERGY
ncbi:MAG: toprim domain-containing protein, partial [Lachnospiraceae bacterium]|nr:toprim domain-containing protein [Lachnospiraceae bacterium]